MEFMEEKYFQLHLDTTYKTTQFRNHYQVPSTKHDVFVNRINQLINKHFEPILVCWGSFLKTYKKVSLAVSKLLGIY